MAPDRAGQPVQARTRLMRHRMPDAPAGGWCTAQSAAPVSTTRDDDPGDDVWPHACPDAACPGPVDVEGRDRHVGQHQGDRPVHELRRWSRRCRPLAGPGTAQQVQVVAASSATRGWRRRSPPRAPGAGTRSRAASLRTRRASSRVLDSSRCGSSPEYADPVVMRQQVSNTNRSALGTAVPRLRRGHPWSRGPTRAVDTSPECRQSRADGDLAARQPMFAHWSYGSTGLAVSSPWPGYLRSP